MADAPNELEVLEARREILQLEIALAQERRAERGARQEGRRRRRRAHGHASSHNAWIFRSIVSVSAYLELGVLSLQQETDDRLEDLATYVEGELDVERGDDGKPLDPDGDALVHFNELNKKIAEIDSVLERTRNTLTGVLELAAELEDFFVANKGPRTVITKETADATVAQLLEETTAYPPRSKRTTRIQKEIRSNRATQIAKQAAVKSVASNKKDKPCAGGCARGRRTSSTLGRRRVETRLRAGCR
ncbi:hypothetical protein RI054_05g26020 [Pseudoscourfieldia marina]